MYGLGCRAEAVGFRLYGLGCKLVDFEYRGLDLERSEVFFHLTGNHLLGGSGGLNNWLNNGDN